MICLNDFALVFTFCKIFYRKLKAKAKLKMQLRIKRLSLASKTLLYEQNT